MLKIRNGVFETNSSSCHVLSMKIDSPIDKNIFLQKFVVTPFTEKEIRENDLLIFTSVIDKLRYLLTCTLFEKHSPNSRVIKFFKKLFPNAIFKTDVDDWYYIEDSEFLFEKNPEIIIPRSNYKDWNIEQWKQWFCNGTVVVFNRDYYARHLSDVNPEDEFSLHGNSEVIAAWLKFSDNNYYALSFEG